MKNIATVHTPTLFMSICSMTVFWLSPCIPANAQHVKTSVKITSLRSGVDASFRGLAVSGPKQAWVTGSQGTVIHTQDGGATWTRISVPNTSELDFRDVAVLSDGTVLLMSIGSGETSRIFRSSDAGETWKVTLTNKDPDGFFDGMTFASDGKTGVLFGDPIQDKMDLYTTADGGETWLRSAKANRPSLLKGEYGFAASGTGVVVLDKSIWIATGGSVARIHHSPDSGATWQTYNTPLRSGNESSGIFSLAFLDKNRAVAIGGDYLKPELSANNVATSSDGGKTWNVPTGVTMPHKACVQSLGDNQLLTCGRTGVAYSVDAGTTWTQVSDDSYYTLAADIQSGTGFLAGKDGSVARFEITKRQ